MTALPNILLAATPGSAAAAAGAYSSADFCETLCKLTCDVSMDTSCSDAETSQNKYLEACRQDCKNIVRNGDNRDLTFGANTKLTVHSVETDLLTVNNSGKDDTVKFAGDLSIGQLYSQGIHNDSGYITTEGLNVGTTKVGTKNQPTMQVYSDHVGIQSAINLNMVPGTNKDSCPINISYASNSHDCILGFPQLKNYASLEETTAMDIK